MTKHEIIENRESNIKLEFKSGVIALIVSLIFVFSNHISQFYQIYYVLCLFLIHQINQAIIFNRWNFSIEYKSSKIWLRIILIMLVLVVVFLNFTSINSDFSYYFNLASGKKANTFFSVAIYCGVYFIMYLVGLKKMNIRS